MLPSHLAVAPLASLFLPFTRCCAVLLIARILISHKQMESLVVGDEDGKVSLYQHGSNEFSSFVTEIPLGLSVRAVKFSPNGHRVAVASE